MINLIKVLLFATLIIPNLAICEKEQVLVFAAASTKNALDAVIKDYNARTKTEILPVYGSSATLAKQIEFGAPADIFLSANLPWVDHLIEQDIIQADNVRTALQYLVSRNVVFAIVYASDAKLFPELKVIGIFDDFTHDPIIYPASLINLGSEEADLFFKYLVQSETLKVFEEYGFLISARD